MDDIEKELADHINDENHNQAVLDDRAVMNELFGDENEMIEVNEPQTKFVNVIPDDITKVTKPKRVMLKLDLDRLFSDRGLSAIPNHIKPLKFKGKGHELDDITNICRAYEHWAHRLFPKMKFKDVLEKIEQLGMKNRRKCFNHRSEIYEKERQLAVITGKENLSDDDDDVVWPEPEDTAAEIPTENSVTEGDSSENTQPLTALQLERMRLNRLKAIQRKKDRENGVQRSNQISPLVTFANFHENSTESSESEYQTPSKRFKPDSSSNSLKNTQSLSEMDDAENLAMSYSPKSHPSQSSMSIDDSAAVSLEIEQKMSISTQGTDSAMSYSDSVEKMNVSPDKKDCSSDETMTHVSQDIRSEIDQLVDE